MGTEARARQARQRERAAGTTVSTPLTLNSALGQRLLQMADDLPPWTEFQPGVNKVYAGGRTREQVIEELVRMTDTSPEAAEDIVANLEQEEVWLNSRYQVNVRRQKPKQPGLPDLVHLSIKRRDKLALGRERFRDLQRIKNELVGPECEAVEVYPAESRLVDTSNQYHLWVFDDPTFRYPFGFDSRLVTDDSLIGSIQQPFDDEED
jgi:hypothetical protein